MVEQPEEIVLLDLALIVRVSREYRVEIAPGVWLEATPELHQWLAAVQNQDDAYRMLHAAMTAPATKG
jgi:hypothetical protein